MTTPANTRRRRPRAGRVFSSSEPVPCPLCYRPMVERDAVYACENPVHPEPVLRPKRGAS